MTWRDSTREEIQAYYAEEFPSHLGELPAFITPNGPKEYALAFREQFPAKGRGKRDFIRRETWVTTDDGEQARPTIEGWPDVLNLIRDPAGNDPLRDTTETSGLADPDTLPSVQRPVPAAVYFSADQWDRNWLLPVDIDAKDVAYERALCESTPRNDESKDEFYERVGITQAEPEGYNYAFGDIEQALVYAFAVRDIFEETLNAEKTQVVYSGQGAHIYLYDGDLSHRYDQASREALIEFLEHEHEIPIDSVVTADEARVMRLPYSLHAGVSRVVTPVDDPDFDFRTEAVPDALTADEKAPQ